MPATFIGVRHHSPACARLVGERIAALRPAYVLVEGPADMNERIGELLLGHDLPIAVFSSYRDEQRHAGSWAPFCEYSPEWVALQAGRAAGAEVRFIDLPAWHEALAGRENRYSDAEERYAEAVDRLCEAFAVDNVDSLWDHLFEVDAADGAGSEIEARLAAYFDLLRGESEASAGDRAREEYMARWVRAAVREAGERPVVVVTGGFHRPALIRLTAQDTGVSRGGDGSGGFPARIEGGDSHTASRGDGRMADSNGDGGEADGRGGEGGGREGGGREGGGREGGGGGRDGGGEEGGCGSGGDGGEDEGRNGEGGGREGDRGEGRGDWRESHDGGGRDGKSRDNDGDGEDKFGGPEVRDGLSREGGERAKVHSGPAVDEGGAQWPEAPVLPAGAVGGSYLVPYSFRRLDAFDGYQSGMPSPEYYQRLWDDGAERAAEGLVAAVVGRLRERKQRASTADLIAARASAGGLAAVRGHRYPARTDILDGLAAALVQDALDERLPWAGRGRLRAGTHPVVVEMVAALSGERVGRLHKDTPLPPLVHDVAAEVEREGLRGAIALGLTSVDGLRRSRVLHRLRVLRIPGFVRRHGPSTGIDPVLDERWTVDEHEHRLPALIEAGAYGATLETAAAARIGERISEANGRVGVLAEALFDAALCGTTELSDQVLKDLGLGIAAAQELGELGRLLGVLLALWRHDRLLGTAGSAALGAVLRSSHDRVLWLAEGVRGGSVPADPARIGAVVALRDVVRHAAGELGLDREASLGVMGRVAAGTEAPPDLRGAAFGFGWALGAQGDPVRAVRGAGGPVALGDWLAGLFAVAREEVLHAGGVLDLLDELVSGLGAEDFLVALPALRQAFAYFPPRERETIAGHVLARRGRSGSGRALLRSPAADPMVLAQAAALEARVDATLTRHGLTP
ncbi:DUF5682 family protein [Dactylosporangium sp. CS-033363]|uniref:DUF5682 family protein n=1 Tax=Dactylosporangium sp. CS-033363 TaxID=3239935 RepID=UPI003D8B2637